jgi:thiol-disulfide isomerase/thioredoxin
VGFTGLFVGVAVLGAALVFGLAKIARPARVKTAPSVDFNLAALGVRPGHVTLLQFSSAFCAPCRAVRVLCATVASESVDHVEVDAESNLAAVRALNVWKTPTLFLVDASGSVAGRIQGVPSLADLRNAVEAIHA